MDDRSSALASGASRDRVATNPAAPHATHGGHGAAPDTSYSPKSLGPKYPPHTMDGPLFEPIDMAGLVAAIVITLGPLAAYSLGWGA